MQTKSFIAMFLGIAAVLGNALPSKAVCLMDCGPEHSRPAEKENNGNVNKVVGFLASGLGFFVVGNITNGVVLNGVQMHSENHVNIGGSNSGDVNTTSNAVIMGVDQSNHNATNTNTNTNQKR